jgi:two-component system, sensor histidine kinase
MRPDPSALLLPASSTDQSAPDDPELRRLIGAERVRMLFAPTMTVATASAITSVALSMLVAKQVGADKAGIWAALSVIVSLLRIWHLHRYKASDQRDNDYWLRTLTFLCGLQGAVWGLAGFFMPVHDLITTAVVVATLIGASTVCTFTLQAHMHPILAVNLPMLLPAVAMLFSRHDAYGLYGGVGVTTIGVLILFECRRVERRTVELLWLRFTTDRIAQERTEALRLAQRHSAVKDQFLATMSHEMRTPLHGILGLTRLVHGRLPSRAGVINESRHQLELIERTGEHLLGIINDVLDFSRIEAGKLHITPAAFDLHHTLDDVLSLMRVTAADKGLALHTQADLPRPCWVMGDATRVRQLLHNLVGNAIKFTEHGEVRVSAWRVKGPLGTADMAATEIVLRVEDTGVGIPAEHLPRVFEAFHQVDGSYGRKHKGTGLGLTISREIARAMGGDIHCESLPGKGSVFTLSVPLPDVAADARPSDSQLITQIAQTLHAQGLLDHEPRTARRPHILLAEDNSVNAIVAEAALAILHMDVTRVENGREALQVLQHSASPFDAVLMDCQMPRAACASGSWTKAAPACR